MEIMIYANGDYRNEFIHDSRIMVQVIGIGWFGIVNKDKGIYAVAFDKDMPITETVASGSYSPIIDIYELKHTWHLLNDKEKTALYICSKHLENAFDYFRNRFDLNFKERFTIREKLKQYKEVMQEIYHKEKDN